ncbi:uncharacterized mitochondrial protein-like protein [Tanacetum coccineum]
MVDDDQEAAKMKELMKIVPDEEEVAIDVIHQATKPPSIIDYKIIKEGKISYFQIIRANGSSKRYSAFIQMLRNIDREDLETLWKLVKAKHGYKGPEEGYERVLWGDLKIMFEHHVEDIVWRNLQGNKVKFRESLKQERIATIAQFKGEGDELERESIKKQKMDKDKETAELKSLMEVIPDEEEVAVDAIPLATKPPSIVEWKIHKEGKKIYYQIIKADGSSKMYLVFSHMPKSFDREDLETLYKLVKAKYGSTRPVEDLDLVLYGDLKTMFDPHVEYQISLLKDMGLESAHMVAASKVPMLKPKNGNSAPKTTVVEGVEKLEILGEKLSQEDVNQKLLRSLSPEWNTHTVVWRNKPGLEKMSMDDLYKNLKVYEPEVKGTSSSSSNIQNVAFVSLNCTIITNGAFNTAHDVTTASTQATAVNSTTIDNLSDVVIYGLEVADGYANNEGKEILKEDWKKAYCEWALRNQENRNMESTRRSVPVETTTSNALISCDSLVLILRFEKSELMVLAYKTGEMTIGELRKKLEIVQKEKDGNQFNVDKLENASKSLNNIIESQIVDNCKKGLGYNAVPPPIIGNFMPSKHDLSGLEEFVNEPIVNEPTFKKSIVETSEAKASVDKPKAKKEKKTVKSSFAKIKFVKSKEQVKSPRKTTVKQEIDGGYVAFRGNPKGGKITGRGKFDVKADEGFFVGENTPNIVESGPNWLFDIDALTKSMNYKPDVAGNQYNSNAGTKSCDDTGKAKMETVPGKDYVLLPLWHVDPLLSQNSKSSPDAGFKSLGDNEKKVTEEPRKESGDSSNDQEKEDDNVNSTNNVNAVSLTVNVVGIEVNVVGAKTSIELPDDPNMPELEDIVYSDDYEDVSAEADKNNLNTFIPMDVKSAFLYGKIKEEVYVCQPPGFEDPDFLDIVYKVEKALYGLHQAPKSWYETLSTYLLDNRFQRGKINNTLFIRRDKGDILLVQVQDKYVTEILKKFGFTDVKTASTPMETQKPLLKDEDGKEVDVHLYRSIIGSLIYLTSSRPDIMFAVCAYARYQDNLKVSHLHTMKRIFRYLKGQPKLGLWYLKDLPFDLVAYTDSDYARASLDRKSTT